MLIAELHSREYDWEAIARAGLRFSDVREEELLHWLRRDAAKFQALLNNASLGLSTLKTAQLLRALSRRPDLAAALRETGLGIGADFECGFDESPRDGGCQIRCNSGGRFGRGGDPCARAHDKCKSLGHCVSVDANREKTWATLKSLQVYMPRPVPTCDGYAFGANGSAPLPIEAPRFVTFDDLLTNGVSAGDEVPQEGWCYRNTGVPMPPKGRGCSMETCFDLARCTAVKAASATGAARMPLPLFIDTPTPKTPDMARLPSCLRQTLHTSLVPDAADACLVMPTVNINCEWDVCDPATHAMLRGMPSWKGRGLNHLIWDYIDAPRVKYRVDDALLLKTSMRLSEYRPGFDVPFPLLPNGEASHVTPAEIDAAKTRRTLLASFKGVCQGSSNRPKLQRLHNGRDIVAVCTGGRHGGGAAAAQYDYKTLMLTSTFSFAPAGNGLHSFRLAEAIFFGSIPVIVDEQITLPFCSVIDWARFSVRVAPHEIPKLPQKLRAIPKEEVAKMQQRLAEVKGRYLLYPFNTAMALMRLRVRAAALRGKA